MKIRGADGNTFASMKFVKAIGAAGCLSLVYACGGGGETPTPNAAVQTSVVQAPTTTVETQEPLFTDTTLASGLDFQLNGFDLPADGSEIPLIFPHGVAAGDYDNDGDIDLFITRYGPGANHLFRNRGDMTFEDVAGAAGLAFTKDTNSSFHHGSPAFVDLNSDEFLDLFIPGLDGDPTMIFMANGDGTFSQASAGFGLDTMTAMHSHSPAFGDYDLDGDLDVFLGHWGTPRDFDNIGDTESLWRNDSDASGLTFTSVSVSAGIAPSILSRTDPLIVFRGFDYTFTPSFTRVNDDAWPDLLVVGDFNTSQVFINQGDGTFANETDFGVIIDGNGMGSAVGDFDNDGDLDWFVSSILARPETAPDGTTQAVPSNYSDIGNRLYRNNSGVFEDVTDATGVADGGWGWASCFIDFENDGDLDIYHTNGWPEPGFGNFTIDTSRAFVAGDDGRFVDRSEELGLADTEQGRGIVCDDFDNDGDVDILVLHRNESNSLTLWRNGYEGVNDYLKVQLRANGANTQAIGARVTVTVDGETFRKVVALGSNFASHNSTIQHFGLGDRQSLANIVIEWPTGDQTELRDVALNQQVNITQGM